jgi:hypothetical protein
MIDLFLYGSENQGKGSPVYAEAILRVFRQDTLTGLVEIKLAAGERLVFLFAEGNAFGAYRLTETSSTEFAHTDLPRFWPAGEATIRSVNVPKQAVRSARALLDWYPPTESLSIPSGAIKDHLEAHNASQFNGLVYLTWPKADGVVAQAGGRTLTNETLFFAPPGVQLGAAALRLITTRPDEPCQVHHFTARPETVAYQQQLLRASGADLCHEIIGRYQQMVGQSLTTALSKEINGLMRTQGMSVELIGVALLDNHVFTSNDIAARVYRMVLRTVNAHISKVVGTGLTYNIFIESFNKLAPESQQFIKDQGLLRGIAFD